MEPYPVQITALRKTFGVPGGKPIEALAGVDLKVEAGQVVGLLGPNGAGKSTLLKILLGLQSADAGEATLWGVSGRVRAVRARVGYLPEGDEFAATATVGEVIGDGARLAGWRGAEARAAAAEVLRELGLEAAEKRRVAACSRGMRRRLGLALAMVGRPDLLILDEPTAGLDPWAVAEFAERVLAWREAGQSVLLCSHRLDQVERICDTVVILDAGRVVAAGTVAELAERAASTAAVTLAGLSGAQRASLRAWAAEEGLPLAALREGSLEALYLAAVRAGEEVEK